MPRNSLHARVEASLAKRRKNGNLRTLGPPAYDPSQLVDFSSNDYLSLSRSSALQQRFRNAVSSSDGCQGSPSTATSSSSKATFGPASSRLLDGNSPSHLALEQRLATFFRGEAALLFNSGFDANAGVFACLPAQDDAMLYDELIHASAHDGMRGSRSRTRMPFKHNNADDLRRVMQDLLRSERGQSLKEGRSQVFVAVEALYSMDGDLAPLRQFAEVVEELLPRGNGHLIVDEAHSTGLYGPQGRGLVCALEMEERVLIRLHTFGKAFACSGGVVLCSPQLRNYFINYARPLIYSTVMPLLMVTAIGCALSHCEAGHADEAISNLHALATHCNNLLASRLHGLTNVTQLAASRPPRAAIPTAPPPSVPSTSPIIPILTDDPRNLSQYLIKSGYLVRPIAFPTVPKHEERVRICLHAHNTRQEVEGLVDTIVKWADEQRSSSSGLVSAKL